MNNLIILYQNFIAKFLNFVFPNKCLSCNKIIDIEGLFCNEDWKNLQFITEPKCRICAYPLESENLISKEILCLNCLDKRPNFDNNISIFRYNEAIASVIQKLKYYDSTYLSDKFGKILWQKISKNIDKYNFVAPVPIHKNKLKNRKFNQSTLIAISILKYAKKDGKNFKICKDLLIRKLDTDSQTKLSREKRERNLINVFEFNKKYLTQIQNKSILLIDDVMTTGATLNICSEILKKAGAKNVSTATIARTVLKK